MRILLVEDDPMIGRSGQPALKDAAYAVDWVKNGLTALQVLADQEHEAVLLDLGSRKDGPFGTRTPGSTAKRYRC